MEILLIGNGFDLEHKLPTTYLDFLHFCDAVVKILEVPSIDPDLSSIQHIQKQQYLSSRSPVHKEITTLLISTFSRQYKDMSLSTVVIEFLAYIQDNLWYIYFKNRLSSLGGNWIDFEKEISHVIQTLESVYITLDQNSNSLALSDNLKSTIEEIANKFNKTWFIICANKESLLSFRDILSEHLDRFIYALEIYLSAFVGKVTISEKETAPDIEPLHPDMVLSFNYTNTYERVYGKNHDIEYCYIHGKAEHGNTTESCNLVLGIDEHLTDDRKNTDLDFLHFKKYYQRIYKSTDNNYLNWIDDIRNYPEDTHTLYIFGHSLDITDKDVLHQLIGNDNVQTKIFYYRKHEYDKSVLGQLIRNLIRIIGQDELIRRTGGSHKTIEFIPQTLRE